MMKKEYIAPSMEEIRIATVGMLASSALDSTSDTQDIIPSDDPIDLIGGEFGAPELNPFIF